MNIIDMIVLCMLELNVVLFGYLALTLRDYRFTPRANALIAVVYLLLSIGYFIIYF